MKFFRLWVFVIEQINFAKRRERFFSQLGANAAIIPAATMVVHHADCEYPFRQNSDFWYLTGFDEPNAVALFLPHKPKGEQYVLFVLPKEPGAEVWTGFRWGTKGVLDNFDVDISHPLNELPNLLLNYLPCNEEHRRYHLKQLLIHKQVLESPSPENIFLFELVILSHSFPGEQIL